MINTLKRVEEEVELNLVKVRRRDSIQEAVKLILWGRAAGRCEFAGCNRPLWKSSVTQERINLAQFAHIYAFSRRGPRGNEGLSREQLRAAENLLLVCGDCHRLIDSGEYRQRYRVASVLDMKREHETRVERVSDIAPGKKSHILLYGANIGEHSSPLTYPRAAEALLARGSYPAEDRPLALNLVNSALTDRDVEFWKAEARQLRRSYLQMVGERLAHGGLERLSVFARAPQPLLVLLGSLLTDIPAAEVFQLHREPEQTWEWPQNPVTQGFQVLEPLSRNGPPALILALSATVHAERIQAVLGSEATTYTVSVAEPHNDLLKSPTQLLEFRSILRRLLDRIKAEHGQTTTLHIFPAAPVSVAVEVGRVRMPKADMPWRIYDQCNARGGFVPALDIPVNEVP